jgi:hypothetical protein
MGSVLIFQGEESVPASRAFALVRSFVRSFVRSLDGGVVSVLVITRAASATATAVFLLAL